MIGGGVEVVKKEDQVNLGQILYIYLKVIPFHPEREARDWNGADSRQKCGVACYAGASSLKTIFRRLFFLVEDYTVYLVDFTT